MGNILGHYIQNIAMIIIFTTFVNLIMPNGDFKKYIKIVLGLIVIITILAPIDTLLFKNKPNYEDILKRYEIDIQKTTMQAQSSLYLQTQKSIILDTYKERIMPQMIRIIEKGNEVKVVYLDIDLDEDKNSKTYGTIASIDMVVQSGAQEVEEKKIIIPKIKVGTKKNQTESTVTNEGQIEKKIKTSLIDFYNLSDVNINITVQKNS